MDQVTYRVVQAKSPYVGKYLRVRFSYLNDLCVFLLSPEVKKKMFRCDF